MTKCIESKYVHFDATAKRFCWCNHPGRITGNPPASMSMTTFCGHLDAGHFRNLRGILISPVPRIYDTQNDVTAPLEDEVRMLGANMDVEAIPKAADDAKKRVHQEVMEPLLEWLSAYRVISVSALLHMMQAGCCAEYNSVSMLNMQYCC